MAGTFSKIDLAIIFAVVVAVVILVVAAVALTLSTQNYGSSKTKSSAILRFRSSSSPGRCLPGQDSLSHRFVTVSSS